MAVADHAQFSTYDGQQWSALGTIHATGIRSVSCPQDRTCMLVTAFSRALSLPLLTGDRRLTRAPDLPCATELAETG